MKNLKQKCINMLCKIGKFGVGKSIVIGIFEFDIPAEIKDEVQIKKDARKQISTEKF